MADARAEIESGSGRNRDLRAVVDYSAPERKAVDLHLAGRRRAAQIVRRPDRDAIGQRGTEIFADPGGIVLVEVAAAARVQDPVRQRRRGRRVSVNEYAPEASVFNEATWVATSVQFGREYRVTTTFPPMISSWRSFRGPSNTVPLTVTASPIEIGFGLTKMLTLVKEGPL